MTWAGDAEDANSSVISACLRKIQREFFLDDDAENKDDSQAQPSAPNPQPKAEASQPGKKKRRKVEHSCKGLGSFQASQRMCALRCAVPPPIFANKTC